MAIEPLPEMFHELLAAVPRVSVLGAVAEALPLKTDSVDALVAAQSWHWFNGTLALLEADRVLVPGGRLGLVWSAYDESTPWLAELASIRARRTIPGERGIAQKLFSVRRLVADRHEAGTRRSAGISQPVFMVGLPQAWARAVAAA